MTQTAQQVQEDIIVEPKVYELPSPEQHLATITRVEDLGIVESELYGGQHKVKIHMRIDDEKDSENKPMFVFQTCTLSLGEKSRLGKFLRQLGIKTSEKFNLAEIVGLHINAGIIHNTKGEKTYANVEYVSRIRTKNTVTVVAAPKAAAVVEDLDEDIPF